MDAVEEIKRRIDAVEYIGRATRLQKSGRNFRGLCPFHTEKTPSFYVFPDRGTWRCFGSCGEGGDIFSFAQKREGLEFRDALRTLAAEAGVELSAANAAQRGRSEHLSGIVAAAVAYYERCFADPAAASEARTYVFETRGIRAETAGTFHIGWAPDEWRGLKEYLAGRGYDERDGIAAGLLVENESGTQVYDRFRGRIIIPIADERGHFVGLGGRILGAGEPKYLNSPQTEIFDKGRTLFALNLAAAGIRATGTAVVVEGYMDVIGPYQAGFTNVIATMGTSLTEHHTALLKRSARRVVLAMDPDAAGMAAAERAGTLFLGFDSPDTAARAARSAETLFAGTELELKVAPLPAGKDPDEVARADPAGWAQAIDESLPYPEFLVNRVIGDATVKSPTEARRVVERLRPVLLAVSDPVERAVYVQRIARRLNVTEAAVFERLRPPSRNARGNEPSRPDPRAPLTPEQALLTILIRHPILRSDFRHIPERLFTDTLDREVFRRWAHEMPEATAEGDDPIERHRASLAARRLPPLGEEQARTAARLKLRQISHERSIEHQTAATEELAAAERELGPRALAELAYGTWQGFVPSDEQRPLAETNIEALELGLSIHRREEPERA